MAVYLEILQHEEAEKQLGLSMDSASRKKNLEEKMKNWAYETALDCYVEQQCPLTAEDFTTFDDEDEEEEFDMEDGEEDFALEEEEDF
jgi:hypothetical protein